MLHVNLFGEFIPTDGDRASKKLSWSSDQMAIFFDNLLYILPLQCDTSFIYDNTLNF